MIFLSCVDKDDNFKRGFVYPLGWRECGVWLEGVGVEKIKNIFFCGEVQPFRILGVKGCMIRFIKGLIHRRNLRMERYRLFTTECYLVSHGFPVVINGRNLIRERIIEITNELGDFVIVNK